MVDSQIIIGDGYTEVVTDARKGLTHLRTKFRDVPDAATQVALLHSAIQQRDAEVQALRDTVGKLPVDAEGKPVVPGQVVWFYDDADVLRSCFALQFVSGILDSILTAYGWVLLKYCYSTEAAARAAGESDVA